MIGLAILIAVTVGLLIAVGQAVRADRARDRAITQRDENMRGWRESMRREETLAIDLGDMSDLLAAERQRHADTRCLLVAEQFRAETHDEQHTCLKSLDGIRAASNVVAFERGAR